MPRRVGVLALQGAFREHRQALERQGAEVREVRLPRDLDGLSGVVFPGGESTTIGKLMAAYGLDGALRALMDLIEQWSTPDGPADDASVLAIERLPS